MPSQLYALCDCNNFFVACERLRHKELAGKPAVVLSSNDGCIVARSEEVKKLGIKMGTPYFSVERLLAYHKVEVFSGDLVWYKEVSNRVMTELARFTDRIEIYSIDEAFLNLAIASIRDKTAYARTIRGAIRDRVGVPISIGVARTKTLAKLAADRAKHDVSGEGVFNLEEYPDLDALLANTPVQEIWGIGRKSAQALARFGVKTALDFCRCDDLWIRKHFTVRGLMTAWELRGQPTGAFGEETEEPEKRKSIQVMRSFGNPAYDFEELAEPVMHFVVSAARKLRNQGSRAGSLCVYIRTSHFAKNRYANTDTVALKTPAANDTELLHHALEALKRIYRPGFAYRKAGVVLSRLCDDASLQTSLFDIDDTETNGNAVKKIASAKRARALKTIDALNRELHGPKILPAALFDSPKKRQDWKPKREHEHTQKPDTN